MKPLHYIKVVFEVTTHLMKILRFHNISIYNFFFYQNLLINECARRILAYKWPSMTFEVILHLIKKKFWHSYRVLVRLDSKQKIYLRKSWVLNLKMTVCDLQWPLSSYSYLWKSYIFILLAFIYFFFIKIINKLARKDIAKITEGQKTEFFLLRFLLTFFNNNIKIT